jgi:hypothetical protein
MSNNLSLLRLPDWSAHQDLWERAIEIGNGPWPDFTPCFIYRDYHPMNMLS